MDEDSQVLKELDQVRQDIHRLDMLVVEMLRHLDVLIEIMTARAPRGAPYTPPYRSGRWVTRDGTFPAQATAGEVSADSQAGNIRPSNER